MLDEIWRQMSFMSCLFLLRKWLLYENIDQILPNILHGPMHYKIGVTCVLYENIDQILPNKLYGPMHYKIGVTCVYNGHIFYTLL